MLSAKNPSPGNPTKTMNGGKGGIETLKRVDATEIGSVTETETIKDATTMTMTVTGTKDEGTGHHGETEIGAHLAIAIQDVIEKTKMTATIETGNVMITSGIGTGTETVIAPGIGKEGETETRIGRGDIGIVTMIGTVRDIVRLILPDMGEIGIGIGTVIVTTIRTRDGVMIGNRSPGVAIDKT